MPVHAVPSNNPAADNAKNNDRGLFVLTVLALVLRVVFVWVEPANGLSGDEHTWTGWAWGANEGLTSARIGFSPFRSEMIFYPPLYPYFLAGARALFGSLIAVKLLQAVLSALLVPAIGRLGGLLFGRSAGLVAAGLVAFYPELVWYAAHFWSETLFLTLMWWAFERLLAGDALASRAAAPPARVVRWLRGAFLAALPFGALRLVWGHDLEPLAGAALVLLAIAGALGLRFLLSRGSAAREAAALAGCLWGLATLTRETLLYFAPVAALWLLWRQRDGLARAVAFAVPLILVVAPWTYRNYVVTHAFVPVATSGALNLWQGNTDLSREQVYVLSEAVRGPGPVRIAQYRYHQRMAWQAIIERQPGWFFDKLVAEMPAFWEADSVALIHLMLKQAYGPYRPGTARLVAAVLLLPYLAVLVLAVAAIPRLRLTRLTGLLLGFLVYYNLLHVITHGFSRYRLPIMPLVFLVAALALARDPSRTGPHLTWQRRLAAVLVGLGWTLSVLPSIGRLAAQPGFRQPGPAAGASPDVRR
jgi:hypothetical protein